MLAYIRICLVYCSCNGFCHATAFLLRVSLTLYYDVIPMVYIVTIRPVPCSVPAMGCVRVVQ